MPHKDIRRLLGPLIRKLGRYGPLDEEEIGFLEQAASRVVEYDGHEAIIHEGDAPSESCLVAEGFACRFKVLQGGTRQIMAFHIPGDFCDLHSFFLKKMDHGAAAMPWCKIVKIPHGKIGEVSEKYPRLMRAFGWNMAVDAAIHREWMVGMGRRDAYQQIAHLLCELLLRLQSVGLSDGNSYEFPATQAELGDAFGLSAVHVNRMLQKLRAEELISFKGRHVTIPDPERLMKAAGFDPTYLDVTDGAVHA
jgi:CRP-like cAMP-binding protein